MEGHDSSSLNIAMCPWFAFGQITPYLHITNKLARKGHRISFFVPNKTQHKLQHLNHFPHLITFVPLTIAHVDGLPSGAKRTSDVPPPLFPLIITKANKPFHSVLKSYQYYSIAFYQTPC
ncbi:hypothetical protein TIFTF001_023065 [Ficus carica]|uniref:Uncharacterized protein n=1 Tax=Ficus carica TaxID=3494 RepID=A0AA88AZU6_FICCA|nr:hypothetical protein TIFTF001_023065 [Ficus carica]